MKLNLHVSNPAGDADLTADYLRAAGWTPPNGVRYDPEQCTLEAEDGEILVAAYKSLAEAVRRNGHADDPDDSEALTRELGPPVLTACPTEDA